MNRLKMLDSNWLSTGLKLSYAVNVDKKCYACISVVRNYIFTYRYFLFTKFLQAHKLSTKTRQQL